MEPRPIIALILRQVIYGLFQLLAYHAYGWIFLVGAWTVLIVVCWIEMKSSLHKVSETIVQTAWFIFILSAVHTGHVAI